MVNRPEKLRKSRPQLSVLVVLALAMVDLPPARAGAVAFADDFDHSERVDNPWSGVDGYNHITVPVGKQMAVSDDGNIAPLPHPPSVAVGDLSGTGLNDLVIADSVGFFWYFQNHGSRQAPKYTRGELMPIWFGDPDSEHPDRDDLVFNNMVPRIQLVDFDGDGKLDLVVGTYTGELYYLRNTGSATRPVFQMPRNLDDIAIPTRRSGDLWCNYIAPYLYDWKHDGHLDLIVGDGSYAANSIFYFANKGSNDQPAFVEENMAKIIPGMGREHLVPQVVSWNGDGKTDILSTERDSYLNIFLKQGNDPATGYPLFDQGHHVTLGGQELMPQPATVVLSNLDNPGMPGLLVASQDGHLSYAKNTGRPDAFEFSSPVPLEGTNDRAKVLRPTGWALDGGYGSPYDLLVCTNAQVEPGFTPPQGTSITSALRFYIDEPPRPNPTFPEHFYPAFDRRFLLREGYTGLKAGTRYKLSFWVRTDGNISDFKYDFWGRQSESPGVPAGDFNIGDSVSASSLWNLFSTTVQFRSYTAEEHALVDFNFKFEFTGKGSIYIASLKLEEAN